MNVKAIVLFLFMISLIGVTGCMNAENKILSHVESTYDEEFEVENVKKGSIIFSEMYGKDKAIVHPKGNKELVFLAGEDRNNEGEYYDTYVLANWGEELKNSLKGLMDKELPDSPYKVYIRAEDGTYDPSMLNMSFEEYLEKNRDISIVLIAGIYTSDKPDVSQYSVALFNIYKELQKYGTASYVVSTGFVDESEDITDYIRTANVNNISWTNLDAKLYGFVSMDERANPEKPDPDISKELVLTDPDAVPGHFRELGE